MNSNIRYLTTADDLKKIISSCKRCSLATRNGNNIISNKELAHLKITKKYSSPIIFICNTADDFDTIGHWFTIVINTRNKLAYLCDGLNYVQTRKDVLKNIHQFCKINKLNFINLKTKCQQNRSNICGYISVFFTAKYVHLTSRNFLQLTSILNRHSVASNESLILQFVQKHFKFKI